MSNCVRGGAPWLSSVNDNKCCTVVEGAEVVRTAAVSYATPILHQVFIKNSSPPYRTVISGSKQNPCYSFKNHFSTSSSNEPEDKTLLASPCVSTSDEPLHTRTTFRKKVEDQLDAVCSEAHLYSSSSIKLPSSFTLSSSSSSSPSSVPSSEAVSSCHSVWSSSSSSSSSPLSLSPEVAAFILPLVSSSVTPTVSSPTTVSLSSPSSPSQALNLSSSSPPLPEPRPDDELTSLSWLQDSNLLRGTTLTSLKPNKSSSLGKRHRPTKKDKNESVATSKSSNSFRRDIEEDSKEESPSSDSVADEPTGELERLQTCQPISNQPVPYNSKVHTMAKPPFSFSCLIFMAIEESSSKALPVKDIYTWIVDHYPYYKSAPTGWKNSVRHNLSLNKCFSKVEKAPSLGKGSLWMVDPNHRPNLLQAMSKAPFTSVSPLDRTFTLSSKAVVNSGWHYNITQKPQETEGKYVLGDVTHKSTEESLNAPLSGAEILCAPMYRKSTSSPKLRIPTRQYHRNTTHDPSSRKLNPAIHCKDKNNLELTSNNNNNTNITNNISVPNPELFPRLAKRLELNSLYEPHINSGSYAIDVQIEDVDAATAMLVLKHGPQMLSPLTETCYQLRKNQNSFTHSLPTGEKRKRDKHSECNADDPKAMYISSSPSVDHSYVSPWEDGGHHENVHCDLRAERSPLFQGMNGTYDENIKPITSERNYHKHPSDEASALFNLASIATQLASKRDEKDCRRSPVGISYSDETQTLFPETQSETQLKKTSKRNSTVNKRKLSTKNVNKFNKSEFAITVNSRLSSRKLYKPKAKMFSLELDGELNTKPTKVAKSRYNNNNKDVVNRNKFLKVKKLCLRRHKAC